MGHAVARHGNERMSQQPADFGRTNCCGSIHPYKIYGENPQYVELFNQAFAVGTGVGVTLPFSRKHEYEADKIGLYIMALAGFDIYQYAHVLGKNGFCNQKSTFDFPEHSPGRQQKNKPPFLPAWTKRLSITEIQI